MTLMEYLSGYNRTLAVQTNNTQVSNESNCSSAYSSNDDIFCTQQLFYLIHFFKFLNFEKKINKISM